MNKKYIWGVLVLLVVAGGSFYGGMIYAQSAATAARTAAFSGGQYTGTRLGGGTRAAGGGLAAGQIIAKDATSITVKLQSGSTTIVLVGSGTTVMKTAVGTLDDLSVGTNVAVTGTTNSDGSVTATTIQVRPQGTPSPQGAGTQPVTTGQ
jgi:hypothetical protein